MAKRRQNCKKMESYMSPSSSRNSYWVQVNLSDPANNTLYTIRVNRQDADRLATDPEFVREVLNNITQSGAKGTNVPDLAGDSLGDESQASSGSHMPTGPGEETGDVEGETVGGRCQTDDSFRWPHESILLLVSLYEQNISKFESPRHTNKSVWRLIAEELNAKGYQVNLKQAESKWSGLKKVYKRNKDHNNKSGNSRRDWMYFDIIHQILGKRPEISPLSTADSSRNSTSNASTPPLFTHVDADSGSDLEGQFETPIPKKRKKRSQEDMFLEMEKNKATRHRERMAQNERMMSLIEKWVGPTNKPR